MSALLDSLLYRQPLPQYLLANARAAEFVRADAGIAEHEVDEDQVFAVMAFDEASGRAERVRNKGDNDAARDILISAARELLTALGAK